MIKYWNNAENTAFIIDPGTRKNNDYRTISRLNLKCNVSQILIVLFYIFNIIITLKSRQNVINLQFKDEIVFKFKSSESWLLYLTD